MSKMKKVILGVILMSLAVVISCSVNADIWEYDENYTRDLIVNTSGFYSNGIPNAVTSVDVIQIYSLTEKKNHVLPLKKLRHQEIVREIRKKEDIVKFFRSFQKLDLQNVKKCSINPADYKRSFHIIAFDSTLMRLAYIRYYICSVEGVQYGVVIPLADEAVYYNTEPPMTFLSHQTSTH